ncbi:MAG TPA: patatin-like protein [Frankiaceae bacterium]|nr:patatin-like protein [Frankiaceae bacterium]
MATLTAEVGSHGLDEDLRIAVVMNGGVSLAIWIGGVSIELNQLTQSKIGDGSVYGRLRELMRCSVRVDVIAGTSAGGINGGFLALAEVYCKGLEPLGDIWADQGGLLDLLRSATVSDPPSLLRGDEYFLPRLREAFDRIVAPYQVGKATAAPRDEAPIHLTMTTSLLNGSVRQYRDDFGTRILEVEHKGAFTFVRREMAPDDADPFTQPSITAELALAARSTASFPVAFEPSYVPVGASPDTLHPDMRGPANFDCSRYVVDGGVLLNKPVRPALDAILAMPADRQVRRVLAYVVPDPGNPVEPKPDRRDDMPTVAKVLADAVVALPRAQSIVEELDELRAHNRRARDRAVVGLELAPLLQDGDELERLADRVFDVYRLVRARRAAAKIAEVVGPRQPLAPNGAASWSYEDLLVAFSAHERAAVRPLPFVPDSRETPGKTWTWSWGIAPAERIAWLTLDLVRRALAIVPPGSELRETLACYRCRVHELRYTLRGLREGDTAFWRARAAALEPRPANPAKAAEKVKAWLDEALALWPVADPKHADRVGEEREAIEYVALHLVDLLLEVAPTVFDAADPANVVGVDQWLHRDAERVRETLVGLRLVPVPPPPAPARSRRRAVPAAPTPPSREETLERLLAMEVVELAISRCPQDYGDPVDLVQVSGDTPNGFGGPAGVADKLAGVQLGHFGAFYKRSWRVNDWIWGRVDGATRLVQVLLDPRRVRRLYAGRGAEFVAAVEDIAFGGAPDLRERWGQQADLDAIRAEVAYLDDETLEPPPALIATAFAVARRIQADLLRTELKRLADAVRVDEREGAGARGPGANFAAAWEARGATMTGAERLTLFAGAGIAREQITEQAGTDLFARTVSKAAAVGVATADSKRSGLGAARLVTRTLRGFTMVLYLLVAGATEGSKVGAWFVNAALAAGGALLAVALLAPDVAGPVKAFAALLVLAGLALSALRSRSWVLALVFGIPFVAVLALVLAPDGRAVLRKDATTIWVTFALVLALMLVGSARTPRTSPWPTRAPRRPAWARKTIDVVARVVGGILPPWARWTLAAALSVALFVVAGRWMQEQSSPRIFDLELAWTAELSASVLHEWAAQVGGLARGRAYLLRDYAFLGAYWLLGAVFVRIAGFALAGAGRGVRKHVWLRTRLGRAAGAAVALSWLPVVAALLDAVENGLLLAQVRAVEGVAPDGFAAAIPGYLPPLTAAAAGWKFVLLVVTGLYVLLGLVVALCAVFMWAVRKLCSPPA